MTTEHGIEILEFVASVFDVLFTLILAITNSNFTAKKERYRFNRTNYN